MRETREEHIERRIRDFHAMRINCAETVLTIFSEEKCVEGGFYPRIATAFGAGLAGRQEMCGALSGALMVIGLALGREVGGDRTPAYQAGRAFIEWFEAQYGTASCREITGIDLSTPEGQAAFRAPGGGHEMICEPMVAEVVRKLLGMYGERELLL